MLKIASASDVNRAFEALYLAVGSVTGKIIEVPHVFVPHTPIVGEHIVQNIHDAAAELEECHRRNA
jgi:hypothetical protein